MQITLTTQIIYMYNILVTGGNGQLGSELKEIAPITKIITFYLQMLKT